jgi:hypothetical protein
LTMLLESRIEAGQGDSANSPIRSLSMWLLWGLTQDNRRIEA